MHVVVTHLRVYLHIRAVGAACLGAHQIADEMFLFKQPPQFSPSLTIQMLGVCTPLVLFDVRQTLQHLGSPFS